MNATTNNIHHTYMCKKQTEPFEFRCKTVKAHGKTSNGSFHDRKARTIDDVTLHWAI